MMLPILISVCVCVLSLTSDIYRVELSFIKIARNPNFNLTSLLGYNRRCG
jgi:hypothetical protein